MKINISCFCILLFINSISQAGIFKIINRNYGLASAYSQYIDPVFNLLEDQINAFLPLTDNSVFIKNMANVAALSGAGNAANYGSSIDVFQLGAEAGIAVGAANSPSGGNFSLNNVSAFGGQASVLLGLNLGIFGKNLWGIDLKKAWGYLGFMTYNYSKDNVSLGFSAVTLYGQVRILEPKGYLLNSVKWNGVLVGSGARYVRLKASFAQFVSQTSSQVEPSIPLSPTVTTSFAGTLNAGADIYTVSIPAEISTSVRLLYVFTPFVGFGADFNTGLSKSIGNITAPVTVTESSGAYGSLSGTGYLDIGDQATPTIADLRFFSGVQFELGVAAAHITTTQNLFTKDKAINAGVKVYW